VTVNFRVVYGIFGVVVVFSAPSSDSPDLPGFLRLIEFSWCQNFKNLEAASGTYLTYAMMELKVIHL